MSKRPRAPKRDRTRKAQNAASRRSSSARRSEGGSSTAGWEGAFRDSLLISVFSSLLILGTDWHDYREASPWPLESVTVLSSQPTGQRCEQEWFEKRRSGSRGEEHRTQYRSAAPPDGLPAYFTYDQCGRSKIGFTLSAVRIVHDDGTFELKLAPPRDLTQVFKPAGVTFLLVLPAATVVVALTGRTKRRRTRD